MLFLLLACDPAVTPAGPSELARDGGPVVLSTSSVPHDDKGAEQAPTDGEIPVDSDRVDAAGLIGIEKFDGDGDRKVFTRRVGHEFTTELVVAESVDGVWTEEIRLFGAPMPDRPAISDDGETIAFTSGISGLASVWVMPFEGGVDPVQLTNVGLHLKKRSPGAPPEGFVPPPIDDSLAFDGDDLEWNGPDGAHSVRWR